MSLSRFRPKVATWTLWVSFFLLAWSPCIYGLGNAYLTGTGMFAPRSPGGPPFYVLDAYCADHGIGSWERCVGMWQAGRITEGELKGY